MITYRHLGSNGRLGNQLWQIASTIGIAVAAGDRAGFPFWRYRPFFCVPDECFPNLWEIDSRDLGAAYLQDLANVAPVADRVREYFRPPGPLEDDLRRRHAALFELPHRTVVHVRRGDYLRHPGHFRWLQTSFFEEAMARCREPYIVFSDDLAWCRERFSSDCHFVERNLDYEDFHLMSLLGNEFIISNSTFSWWAAWLSGMKTVAPREWWGPGLGETDASLALPAEWDLL